MDISTYFEMETLKTIFSPYYQSLKNFQFLFYNPLFWVFLLILFFILLRFWESGKAFSFCLIIAGVLLGLTRLESFLTTLLAKHGASFDPLPLRILSIVIIVVVSVCYFFISFFLE